MSLNSRIMVASGGASGSELEAGVNGGGLIGYDGKSGTGATQVVGGGPNLGGFGKAGIPVNNSSYCSQSDRSGASSGYYSGGASNLSGNNLTGKGSAGSGSSYISGHTGCVAITSESDQTPKIGCDTGSNDNNCSIHYSGFVFNNTVMIDGSGYHWMNAKQGQIQMPSPSGGSYNLGVGHTGNGFVRITYVRGS